MRHAQLHRIRPDITHAMYCRCPTCKPLMPHDPPRSLLGRIPARAPALFALGMATGAIGVAATGNLGAALRALVGL